VIKILSNGNYFIDGSRELLINGFLLDVVEKITDLEVKNLIKNKMGFKE